MSTPSETIHAVSRVLTNNRLSLSDAEYLGGGDYKLCARDPVTGRSAMVETSMSSPAWPIAHRLIDALRKEANLG